MRATFVFSFNSYAVNEAQDADAPAEETTAAGETAAAEETTEAETTAAQ